MEISVLQSLIDRTSNEIAAYEAAIRWEQEYIPESDFEIAQSQYTVQYYKSRIPKLVKIQKALKKEIKQKIIIARLIKKIIPLKVVSDNPNLPKIEIPYQEWFDMYE